MPIQTLTLADIRTQIKTDAKVSGSDNLDSYITNLLNEYLLLYATEKRYMELLVLNHEIPTLAGIGEYELPANFMEAKFIRHRAASSFTRTLNKPNGFVETPSGSLPKYYIIAGTTLNVQPFADLLAGDTIILDYYRYPDQLVEDTDVFPIPRLLAPIKQRVAHRVMIYNKELQQAAALKAESIEHEARGHQSHN